MAVKVNIFNFSLDYFQFLIYYNYRYKNYFYINYSMVNNKINRYYYTSIVTQGARYEKRKLHKHGSGKN